MCLNSYYRFWGLVVGTKNVKLCIGSHVRKRIISHQQPKYIHIKCWTLPLLLLCSFSNLSVTSPTSQRILQPFRLVSYVTAHSENPSVASPTSQFILQPFFRFSCVASSSLNSPGEPPMGHPSDMRGIRFESELFLFCPFRRNICTI